MSRRFEIPQLQGIFAEPWSWKKLIGLLGVFGPAAIVASVAIGAGETIVVVRAGAWAGYDLLWLVLLSCIAKGIFVTYLIGRYTAVSGELIGHRVVRFPGPRGWLLMLILLMEFFAAPMGWVAISKPCGDLFHYILPLPDTFSEPVWENLIATCFIGLALGLGIRLSYDKVAKQPLLICGILVSGTIIWTMMVRPDFVKALVGMFSFGHFSDFPSRLPEDPVQVHGLLLEPPTPPDIRPPAYQLPVASLELLLVLLLLVVGFRGWRPSSRRCWRRGRRRGRGRGDHGLDALGHGHR